MKYVKDDDFKEMENRPPTPETQGDRVVKRFGGVRRLVALLKHYGRPYNAATVYRWTYPKSKGGTGGIIPTAAWPDILYIARMEGVVLGVDEMDIRAKYPKEVRVKDAKAPAPREFKKMIGRK